MEIADIKKLSIDSFMIRRGYRWVKSGSKNTHYLSPFRSESNPSFVVDKYKNTFMDYGDESHGDIIALVQKLDNVGFKEACDILLDRTKPIAIYQEPKVKPKAIDVVEVKELKDARLLEYMRKRGISVETAKRHCEEVTFNHPASRFPGKLYKAVGFKNDQGGYELRYENIKKSTTPKCFTTIEGKGRVNIFEGFMDYLSALEYFGVKTLGTTYVLNGCGMVKMLSPFLKGKVNCFTDNDDAGDRVIEELREVVEVNDCRYFFEFHNDFNELIA